MTYVGYIYVGSNMDKGLVTFDTGSTTATIATSTCDTCEDQVYDYSNSTTSEVFDPDATEEVSIVYGSVVLNGTYFLDSLCLEYDAVCANEMKILGIEWQQGLGYGEDGILGLSPYYRNDSSLVWALYNSGVIDNKILGFATMPLGQQSVATFGGVNSTYIAGLIYKIDLINDFYWEVPLAGAAYAWQSFKRVGKSAIFDTGSSYVFMPAEDFQAFGQIMMDMYGPLMYCEVLCIYQKPCDFIKDRMEPVLFDFGLPYKFLATPDKYLIDG
eukprot:CAMPEP_0202956704 /NCGR_PEP_ID=MMETSP1396-20130829/1205_1 /ASSEMBLY_ACC=CAM_ASM_000872 /TAXON_ID= /ORGANISM="Pseudokeronopsis sp., Strain Brazil" /LENGTH=270 /DNA_ID=CAMNT_0049673843 /DNA_START=127 /DNA_END=939 /DNA_ORIENTATION=+